MSGKLYVLIFAAALAAALIAGCGNGTATSGPGAGSPTSTPIASTSAVAKAKEQAIACLEKTSVSALLSSSGRSELVNCLTAIVPPAKQQVFKHCIAGAAVSDKVWTQDGRTRFVDTSLPGCLDQASTATPTTSP